MCAIVLDGTHLDADTVDLVTLDTQHLQWEDSTCGAPYIGLTERAHREALVLERRVARDPQLELLFDLFMLYFRAYDLIDYTGQRPPTFYAQVGGLPVELHSLRAAQLVVAYPELLELELHPEARASALYLAEKMQLNPELADQELVLRLLRGERRR